MVCTCISGSDSFVLLNVLRAANELRNGMFVFMQKAPYFLVLRDEILYLRDETFVLGDENLASRDETLVSGEGGNYLHLTGIVFSACTSYNFMNTCCLVVSTSTFHSRTSLHTSCQLFLWPGGLLIHQTFSTEWMTIFMKSLMSGEMSK